MWVVCTAQNGKEPGCVVCDGHATTVPVAVSTVCSKARAPATPRDPPDDTTRVSGARTTGGTHANAVVVPDRTTFSPNKPRMWVPERGSRWVAPFCAVSAPRKSLPTNSSQHPSGGAAGRARRAVTGRGGTAARRGRAPNRRGSGKNGRLRVPHRAGSPTYRAARLYSTDTTTWVTTGSGGAGGARTAAHTQQTGRRLC